jgi:hypothetical protein
MAEIPHDLHREEFKTTARQKHPADHRSKDRRFRMAGTQFAQEASWDGLPAAPESRFATAGGSNLRAETRLPSETLFLLPKIRDSWPYCKGGMQPCLWGDWLKRTSTRRISESIPQPKFLLAPNLFGFAVQVLL